MATRAFTNPLITLTFLSILLASSVCAADSQQIAGKEDDPVRVLMRATSIVSASDAIEAGVIGKHSRRFSEVQFDPEAILSVSDRNGSTLEQAVPRIGVEVELEPFPGERYLAKGHYVENWPGGVWSWVGAIDGYDNAEIVVTVTGNSVYGVMRIGPIIYEIQSGRDSRTYVREPDLAAYEFESACALELAENESSDDTASDQPANNPFPLSEAEGTAPLLLTSGSESQSMQSSSMIDLLLIYSPAAANRYDIEALANNSVASMNQSFIQSGVDASVRIVHYAEVSGYEEDEQMNESDIIQLTVDIANGNNDFVGIPDLRDDHAADLAIFLWDGSKAGDTCGSGYVPSNPDFGNDDRFASNTGDECIAPFNNFTHEIGHLLGGCHDYPDCASIDPGDPGPFDYSHGYTHVDPDFRTIMGSANNCSMSGCDRLNRWSDPSATHQSTAMGVEDESDMVESNNQMADVIRGYRSPSGSAPGAPATVTVSRGFCFELNWVDWSIPSGLLGWYEVQTSTSSGYTNPQLIYRGSSNATINLNVFTETWVRVRACNSSGCSSWKNGDQTAIYYNGCA